jgi:hypothetical protein
MADWFYVSANQQTGPVTREVLQNLITTGTIPSHTLAWRAGLDNWQPANSVPELAGLPPLPSVKPAFPPLPIPAQAVPGRPIAGGVPLVAGKIPTPRWVRWVAVCLGIVFLIRAIHLPWQVPAAFEYVRGLYAESEGNDQEAARLYRASLQTWPESPTVLGHLGVVAVRQSDDKTVGWALQRLAEVKDPHPSNVEEARVDILKAEIAAAKKGHP